jgi:hypothetical protein
MLRKPVEMLYSLHGCMLFGGSETLEDFEAALNAEGERKAGRHLPSPPYLLEGLFYREIAAFTDHTSRYFDVFGRQNVHVILFDDFVKDTARVYRETLEFLSVNPDFRPAFDAINRQPRVRSQSLRRILRNPPPALRVTVRALLPVQVMRRFRRNLTRLNTADAIRPPLDPALKHRLEMEFQPEVERLSRLLGRDLAAWRTPVSRAAHA